MSAPAVSSGGHQKRINVSSGSIPVIALLDCLTPAGRTLELPS